MPRLGCRCRLTLDRIREVDRVQPQGNRPRDGNRFDLLMEPSSYPIEIIAARAGFADRERMRRAFFRASDSHRKRSGEPGSAAWE
ncbi:MAG TPA: hypothetical protein VD978_19985 [Azospirillum sp.]|nr:hypothetical protein [Azospirillum sp.]